MRKCLLVLCLGIFGLLGTKENTYAAEPEYDGYIFRLKDEVAETTNVGELQEIISESTELENISERGNLYTSDSIEAITEVFEENQIEYIEPDYYASLQEIDTASGGTLTNDTYAANQWYLDTVGIQKFWENEVEGQDMDDEVDMDGNGNATDDPIVIAVIDSGLNYNVDDLDYSRILTGVNMLDGSTDVNDEVYHGTFVTGMLVAQKNNQNGIAGMLDEVYVWPIKCFDGQETSYSYIVKAIEYVVEQKLLCERTNGKRGTNVCVINLSLGATAESKALKNACESAMDAGIIIVCAAGNSGNTDEIYPAQYTMGVGSVDREKNASYFSQILSEDGSEGYRNKVWICAPGEELYSYGIEETDGNYIRTGKGTSFSCPIVSALAALCKSIDNTITQEEFMQLTRETATYIDSGSGVIGEQDVKCGYGLVNFENVYNRLLEVEADPCEKGHGYETVQVVEATCSDEGYTLQRCSVCQEEIKTNITEAGGHVYKNVQIVEATCEASGSEKMVCIYCGAVEAEYTIEAVGHTYENIQIVSPSCTDAGYTLQRCSVCQEETKTNITEAGGHVYEIVQVVEATCSDEGYTLQRCSVCQEETKTNITEAGGHVYENVQIVEATCEASGSEKMVCIYCGAVEAEYPIEAVGHTYENIQIVSPSCTDAGYTLQRCGSCQKEIHVNDTEPTGHSYITETAEATCKLTGSERTFCSVCGMEAGIRELPVKAHVYYAEKVVGPTYEGAGYTVFKCQGCGIQMPGKITEKLVLETPIIEAVKNITSGIKITWSQVPDAQKYNIYKKAGSTWKLAGTVEAGTITAFTDNTVINGVTYTYKITAYTTGCESEGSFEQKICYLKGEKLRTVQKNGNRMMTVNYKRNKKATGYEIQYATNRSFRNSKTIIIKGNKKTSKLIRKIHANKKYYVRVRAYKKIANAGKTKKSYGSWSKMLRIKV